MKKYIFLALAFFGLYADSASAYDVYYNLNNGQIFKKSSSDTSAGTALSSVNPS